MEKVKIYIENTSQYLEVEQQTSLKEVSDLVCPKLRTEDGLELPVLSVLVDNKLKSLDYRLINPHNIRFVSYDHSDGRRTYIRSLSFVLQNVVREMYPDKILRIIFSLASGLYCEIQEPENYGDGHPHPCVISETELEAIKSRMKEIIAADLPFTKRRLSLDECIEIFTSNKQKEKADLLKSIGRYYNNVYFLDGQADTFYGPLVPSTAYLEEFDLSPYYEGFCLQYPMEGDFGRLEKVPKNSKIALSLNLYSDWCSMMGVRSLGPLNEKVSSGEVISLINLSEALHERSYAEIADKIYENRDRVKIVFIAGPSSSGKTSTSKRLAIQCRVLGLYPKVIELDNYFVNRESTPRDKYGNYDFESLGAMDLKLLGEQINRLLAGERVEIPRFDFIEGKQLFEGNYMQLGEKDVLIMEGIHAMNPKMIPGVDQSKVFRVYASDLTSLQLDENNNISTADNRMLRRMIRDNRTRGKSPEDTLIQWRSVRRGENRNIFPYQENADAIFNSAHIFELPVLKYLAEPLLRRIAPSSPAYPEATRMLKFLSYIQPLTPDEMAAIPPTSILREFIDGQTL